MVCSGIETLELLEIRLLISFGGPLLQLLQRKGKAHVRDRLNLLSLAEQEPVRQDFSMRTAHLG